MKKEKLSYAEMLKGPRWQKKRLEVMQRDGFRCQHCLSEDKPLQVHHLVYDKDKKPWEYENNQLITLCEDCHQDETEDYRMVYPCFQDLLFQFKSSGLSAAVLCSMINYVTETLYSYNTNNNEKPFFDNQIKKIIEYAVYGAGSLGDVIIASKMGIDVNDYVENVCPEIKDEIKNMED